MRRQKGQAAAAKHRREAQDCGAGDAAWEHRWRLWRGSMELTPTWCITGATSIVRAGLGEKKNDSIRLLPVRVSESAAAPALEPEGTLSSALLQ